MREKTKYLRVKNTGQIVREDTAARWEHEANERRMWTKPGPLRERKRPRPNSRKKRRERNQVERIRSKGKLPIGPKNATILAGVAAGKSHDEIMASVSPPVFRSFVNKKRAARAKAKAKEPITMELGLKRDWFTFGR